MPENESVDLIASLTKTAAEAYSVFRRTGRGKQFEARVRAKVDEALHPPSVLTYRKGSADDDRFPVEKVCQECPLNQDTITNLNACAPVATIKPHETTIAGKHSGKNGCPLTDPQ